LAPVAEPDIGVSEDGVCFAGVFSGGALVGAGSGLWLDAANWPAASGVVVVAAVACAAWAGAVLADECGALWRLPMIRVTPTANAARAANAIHTG
jgi:hypothetical protein